jgi:hypothetical protein
MDIGNWETLRKFPREKKETDFCTWINMIPDFRLIFKQAREEEGRSEHILVREASLKFILYSISIAFLCFFP